jgi:two-component system chemotaxis response regulator CheY
VETILVVDDTAEIRMLLVATLQQAGYDVVEASDGSGVMKCVEAAKPSAIILDLMMPGSMAGRHLSD